MSEVAIRVENLGKKYHLGGKKSGSFRESVNNLFKKSKPKATEAEHEFWALKDINFEIKRGEAVGVIGRNGAGKSTLLKILSRITEPTKGRFEVFGRVSSLLEVGTGFHPELTGRENVYLNGTILGMKRHEVKAKFDEIVAFSGVEKFIDTPVKHYSSGMKVRLAFAVAAHLEPEILIIDEVLAVGDSVFQAKCIKKMTEVTSSGRTVLFVSHNMSAIKQLCNKGVLIDRGYISLHGSINKVVDAYLQFESLEGKCIDLLSLPRSKYANELVFHKINFASSPVKFGEDIQFSIKLFSHEQRLFKDLDFGLAIKDKNSNTLVHISNRFINKYYDHEHDEIEYAFTIANNLKPGIYFFTFFLRTTDVIQDWLSDVVKLEVLDGNPYNFNDTNQISGLVLPHFSIQTSQTLLS